MVRVPVNSVFCPPWNVTVEPLTKLGMFVYLPEGQVYVVPDCAQDTLPLSDPGAVITPFRGSGTCDEKYSVGGLDGAELSSGSVVRRVDAVSTAPVAIDTEPATGEAIATEEPFVPGDGLTVMELYCPIVRPVPELSTVSGENAGPTLMAGAVA